MCVCDVCDVWCVYVCVCVCVYVCLCVGGGGGGVMVIIMYGNPIVCTFTVS